jgi:hypothetical protein
MEQKKHVLLVTNAVTKEEITQVQDAVRTPQLVPVTFKISLVHVIPTLPTCYFNIPSMIMLADRYYQEARDNLARVGDELNISKKDQWLIMGKVRTEVLRLANKLNVQFILANAAHLFELRKSPSTKKEDQRLIINNVSELCAGL